MGIAQIAAIIPVRVGSSFSLLLAPVLLDDAPGVLVPGLQDAR